MNDEDFWDWEYRQRRMARYQARYLSWQAGERVMPPSFFVGEHWIHKPFVYASTGQPVVNRPLDKSHQENPESGRRLHAAPGRNL